MASKYKGLVLAAGFGTRLRPLTNAFPKPLVPFAGTTPLALAVSKLVSLGVESIAVNSHYHSDQIYSATSLSQKMFPDVALKLSHEPEILGTGGALNPLRSWLGDSPLIIINGDVVSSISLTDLVEIHESRRACATMALLPKVIQGETSVFHNNGLIKAISKSEIPSNASSGNFACAQIITKTFVDLLPHEGSFDIISKGYLPALASSLTVAAYIHCGYWHDLGTPKSYLSALLDLFNLPTDALEKTLQLNLRSNQMNLDLSKQSLVHQRARIGAQVVLGPRVIVEADSVLGDRCHITESIILPGAQVSAGETIHRMIIGKDFRLDTASA